MKKPICVNEKYTKTHRDTTIVNRDDIAFSRDYYEEVDPLYCGDDIYGFNLKGELPHEILRHGRKYHSLLRNVQIGWYVDSVNGSYGDVVEIIRDASGVPVCFKIVCVEDTTYIGDQDGDEFYTDMPMNEYLRADTYRIDYVAANTIINFRPKGENLVFPEVRAALRENSDPVQFREVMADD